MDIQAFFRCFTWVRLHKYCVWCRGSSEFSAEPPRPPSHHHHHFREEILLLCVTYILCSNLRNSKSSSPPTSCTDGLGRSCLVLVLLAMLMDPDLPAVLAIECIRQSRGPRAIQTIKVSQGDGLNRGPRELGNEDQPGVCLLSVCLKCREEG